jgi:hypothetical protein
MIASGFTCEANKLLTLLLPLFSFRQDGLVPDFFVLEGQDLQANGWFDWLVACWFFLMDGCWLGLVVGWLV